MQTGLTTNYITSPIISEFNTYFIIIHFYLCKDAVYKGTYIYRKAIKYQDNLL
jgi:hypothetical protein